MAINQTDPVQKPLEHQNWLMLGGIALLGIASISALAVLGGKSSFEPTQPPYTPPAHTATAPSHFPQVSVVRVDAGGNAVIAGSAAPGEKVTIKTNGAAIGTVTADQNGAFAFVTSEPLPPGGQEVTLSARAPDGAEHIAARGVMVTVPAAPNEGALAVLTGKNLSPSRLLGHEEPKTGPLGIGSVDYSGSGSATVAGTAAPDSRVELFMGKTKLGKAIAGTDGRWKMHTHCFAGTIGHVPSESARRKRQCRRGQRRRTRMNIASVMATVMLAAAG